MREYVTDEDERRTVCTLPREEMERRGDLKRLAILVALDEHGEMTTSGVRDVTTLSANDVTYHVPTLEDEGYISVTRRGEADDGANRPSVLTLTTDGTQALRQGTFGEPSKLEQKDRVEELESRVEALEQENEKLREQVGTLDDLVAAVDDDLIDAEDYLYDTINPFVRALVDIVSEETGQDVMARVEEVSDE